MTAIHKSTSIPCRLSMPATSQEQAWAQEPMVADGICEPYMACAMKTYCGL